MSTPNIVIDVQEATAFAVHPIIGASGKTYGHATFDKNRGTMAFRMSLEEWRAAKNDICLAHRPFYGLVIDVEINSDKKTQPESTASLTKKISNLKRKSK